MATHVTVLTPSSAILARDHSPSRSRSPVRRIACTDFEDINFAHPASLTLSLLPSTTYSPQAPSPQSDFGGHEQKQQQPPSSYRNSLTHSFLDKCKLPPLITRATNTPTSGLHTPSSSQPSSGASSPTKSLASFVTSSNNSASTASVRAKHTSKQFFDSFFTGTSAPLNIGILPGSASDSQVRSSPGVDEQDSDDMEGPLSRVPARSGLTTRPKQNDTTRTRSTSSTTMGGRLGGWFTGASRTAPTTSPKTLAGIGPEDPLLNLNITHALFPHGPADPLDPNSYNDLLSTAESLIQTFQSSYRLRCTEARELRAEAAVQKDELEEVETRAEHLKMQLDGMAAQLDVQTQKADMLEKMLEEERSRRKRSDDFTRTTSRRTSVRIVNSDEPNIVWKRGNDSDSGFESDADSLFSEDSPTIASEKTVTSISHVGKVRRQIPQPAANHPPQNHSAPHQNHSLLDPSAFGNADLRNENHALRMRIADLEVAIDGCVQMVSGTWMR